MHKLKMMHRDLKPQTPTREALHAGAPGFQSGLFTLMTWWTVADCVMMVKHDGGYHRSCLESSIEPQPPSSPMFLTYKHERSPVKRQKRLK